ncbi:MAG: hydroxymethylpyrimidine/phosphomethylpyrimidine kinase [Methylococcaceae bacterium]|nr:hydroxymethylpyrimidine/phosphomethylpyrimidine kinase [Methylococcaceae bacterium]
MSRDRPVVLCFSGHDPSGGAGIQADIETIISHQCHAASVITALTEQDSHNVKKLIPQRPGDIISQAETLLADFSVAAIKIGLIGHHETAKAIQQILRDHPAIPVVLDPVLAAGGGTALADRQLLDAIIEGLLPLTTVLTPNSQEARQLANQDDLADCGRSLQAKGAEFVLITGTHETSDLVHNRLFMPEGKTETFNWERLPHSYHGSGCTLASAIAALLAQGLDAFTAITEAQEFTWQSLAAAYKPGQGQYNPDRLFWVES